MKVSEFDFALPEGLIAREPAPVRDLSRLLVLDRGADSLAHRTFRDIAEYLLPGDMLVLNRTKVLPVRLRGRRPDGRSLDILLVREVGGGLWEILSKGGYTGEVSVSPRLSASVEGGRTARLKYEGDLASVLASEGDMPLPPYIGRDPVAEDKIRYQTVYARTPGSIAAPTAGLHFTPELLAAIEDRGVKVRYVTLQVGRGTFTPIRAERLADHRMEAEPFEVPEALVEELRTHRGAVCAVGTTTTRAIEGLLAGRYAPREPSGPGMVAGETDIFIAPGFRFLAVTALITNFHLPRSTPLMLASALAGRERLLGAYAEAVRRGYGFFSYGDAMVIR
jgi:S-adenosylmethionine:tRNA ribosyltransferase-isomerase